MFMRAQIGPCPKWMAETDFSKEIASVEEKWIKTGKMISFQLLPPGGFRMIGPKFMGMGEQEGLTLWSYTFPDFERFREWAIGAPEHIAMHTKLIGAMKASGHQKPLPGYSFHATDDPNADIAAIRAELKKMYQQIEKTDWAGVPAGMIQLMMLGDHE